MTFEHMRSTRHRLGLFALAVSSCWLVTGCSEGRPEPQSVEEEVLQSLDDVAQVKGAAHSSEDDSVQVTIWDPGEDVTDEEALRYAEVAQEAAEDVDVELEVVESSPPQD